MRARARVRACVWVRVYNMDAYVVRHDCARAFASVLVRLFVRVDGALTPIPYTHPYQSGHMCRPS